MRKKSDSQPESSISRRDFLNGAAVGVGSVLVLPKSMKALLAAEQTSPAARYYPPALTGMRGNHDGSFTNAHRLRDGESWDSAADSGEEYDLVVVGGHLVASGFAR